MTKSSSGRSCGAPAQSGQPPTNTQKEEHFREEGTLSGRSRTGGHADPCADRHRPGDGNENGTDGGEGPPQERWRSARFVGPACRRPAYRRGGGFGWPGAGCVGEGEEKFFEFAP